VSIKHPNCLAGRCLTVVSAAIAKQTDCREGEMISQSFAVQHIQNDDPIIDQFINNGQANCTFYPPIFVKLV
jgi:hypothetical protein